MKVNALQCRKCCDIIYSRTDHDFRQCSCKSTFVDGGRSYLRCGYARAEDAIHLEIEIPYSQEELYRDWNKNINQHGLIKVM